MAQCVGHLPEQMALRVRRQQELHADGDHGVETSVEERRGAEGFAPNRKLREPVLEGAHQGRACVDTPDLASSVRKRRSDRDAGATPEV